MDSFFLFKQTVNVKYFAFAESDYTRERIESHHRVSIVLQEVTDQTYEAGFSISAEIDLAHSSAETHSSPALQDST